MTDNYPILDVAGVGLTPVNLDIWQGFMFVRLH